MSQVPSCSGSEAGASLPTDDTLRLEGVVKRFGRNVALRRVSIGWQPGVHGILGANGAGKTTLLRIAGLIDRPSEGRLYLWGEAASTKSARGRIGYLPQSVSAPYRLSSKEMVAYVAALRGVVPRDDAVRSALSKVDGIELGERPVRQLSGGQQRRIGIAAALVGNPELILLDEPTSGLDPQQRISFREMLRSIGRDATVLVSTHLVEDVAMVCDTVMVLQEGSVKFCGTTKQLEDESGGLAGQSSMSRIEQGYLKILEAN